MLWIFFFSFDIAGGRSLVLRGLACPDFPVREKSSMRFRYWLAFGVLMGPALLWAQARNDAPDTVAGIPVNYDEAKVGTYVLPDALTLSNGKTVRDAKTWWKMRRPEIEAMFETE